MTRNGPSHQSRRASDRTSLNTIDHGLAATPAARAIDPALPTASKPCFWHARRATSRSAKRATCTQRTRNALAALLPQAVRVSAVGRRGAAAYADANRLPKRAKMLVCNDADRFTIGSTELFYTTFCVRHIGAIALTASARASLASLPVPPVRPSVRS